MRHAAILAATLSLIALPAAPARAELDAAGTRLSVAGGTPRFYMTYGHLDERELFAPITTELKRLQLLFLVEGDTCTVLHHGERLAEWPVVRSREEIPPAPDAPFILILGSTTYVPVKRLSKVAPIELKRDRQANLLALVAGGRKPAAAATPTPVAAAPPTGAITLSRVELQAAQRGASVRIHASAAVKPTILYLSNPTRVVIDFPNARWAEGLAEPGAVEGVQKVRTGQTSANQARLVLETPSSLKVVAMRTTGGEIALSLEASVSRAPASALEEKVRAAVAQRSKLGAVRVTQSRGGLRFPTPQPGSPPVDPATGNAWQYIVIHHSATPAGNAGSFAAMHRRNKWDGLAYHFVINNGRGNPDGHMEVSPRWTEQKHGAHAGGLPGSAQPGVRNGFNEFGIGICLVGNFQRSQPTDFQLQTLAQLIRELRAEFDIPIENVLGHGAVKGTACPGAAFPWARLFALMDLPAPRAGLLRHPVPQTTARCPWCHENEIGK